jgi:hypothetical protein
MQLFSSGGFVKLVKIIGTVAIATLCIAGNSAIARDGVRATRAAQPHTRTTERQRTETGHTRNDTWTNADGKTATRDAVVTNDKEAGTRTRNVDYTGPNGKTASVDSTRTKTEDGFTRSTTATNAQGETATRDLTVSRDKEAGTVTRSADYTTFNGGTGTKSDVSQRTEDGYTRDVTRTLPNGEVHTRNVDVSCDKAAGNCVKQVGVDQPQP